MYTMFSVCLYHTCIVRVLLPKLPTTTQLCEGVQTPTYSGFIIHAGWSKLMIQTGLRWILPQKLCIFYISVDRSRWSQSVNGITGRHLFRT